MKNVSQIIFEEIQFLFEGSFEGKGAADVAYQRMFNIPASKDANVKALGQMQRQIEKPYSSIPSKTDIYKNPKSLEYFDNNVRAIGDIDGNLFVAQSNSDFTHQELGEAIDIDVWNNEILRLNRVGNSEVFALADNVVGDVPVAEILSKLKQRNLLYDFLNKTYYKK